MPGLSRKLVSTVTHFPVELSILFSKGEPRSSPKNNQLVRIEDTDQDHQEMNPGLAHSVLGDCKTVLGDNFGYCFSCGVSTRKSTSSCKISETC